jgi:hypothetical protein
VVEVSTGPVSWSPDISSSESWVGIRKLSWDVIVSCFRSALTIRLFGSVAIGPLEFQSQSSSSLHSGGSGVQSSSSALRALSSALCRLAAFAMCHPFLAAVHFSTYAALNSAWLGSNIFL